MAFVMVASCTPVRAPAPAQVLVATPAAAPSTAVVAQTESGPASFVDLFCPQIAVDHDDRLYALGIVPPPLVAGATHVPNDGSYRLRLPYDWYYLLATVRPGGLGDLVGRFDDTYWLSPRLASAPGLRGVVVAGRARNGEGPCGVPFNDRGRPFVARYDQGGRCVFGRAIDPDPGQPDVQIDSLAVADEEHVYVAGMVREEREENSATFVERLDASGEVVYRQKSPYFRTIQDQWWSPTPDAGAQRIVAVKDGLVAVVVDSMGQLYMEKLDDQGETRWRSPVFGDSNPPWLASGHDGGIYSAGFSADPPLHPRPHVVVHPLRGMETGAIVFLKHDANGRLLWARTLRDSGHVALLGLTVDAADRVWMLGYFKGQLALGPGVMLHGLKDDDGGVYTLFLARFAPSGIAEWGKVIGEEPSMPPDDFDMRALVPGPSGDVAATILHDGALGFQGRTPGRGSLPGEHGHRCSVLRLRGPRAGD